MAPNLATYNQSPAAGLAGQIALPSEGYRVLSGVALGSLGFGVPVLRDTTNGTSVSHLVWTDRRDVSRLADTSALSSCP